MNESLRGRDGLIREQGLLLAVSEAMVGAESPKLLFEKVWDILQPVLGFGYADASLLDEKNGTGEMYAPSLYAPHTHAKNVTFTPEAYPGWFRYPLELVSRYIDPSLKKIQRVTRRAFEEGMSAEELQLIEGQDLPINFDEYLFCPLLHMEKNIGYITFGYESGYSIGEDVFPFLQKICSLLSHAVVSTAYFERLTLRQRTFDGLLAMATSLLDRRRLERFPFDVAEGLERVLPVDEIAFRGLPMHPGFRLVKKQDGWQEGADVRREWPQDWPKDMRIPVIHQNLWIDMPSERVCAWIRLQPNDSDPLDLCLGTDVRNAIAFQEPDVLEQALPQILLALQGVIQWERNITLQRQLELENRALKREITAGPDFQQIQSESHSFRICLSLARQVAPLDSTVILLGETGAGKEVLARHIHSLSLRYSKPFVRVNCAALPAQLIESELFGHEKGAFTGAVERRIGKFELAQEGTIFLDEIGELSLESQAKLLRVLQERELERLGGHEVVPLDVRVIAATNRNLEDEVRAGRFRADLYYRLNVFPLLLPPLRERKEDIPILAEQFLQKFSRRFNRPLRGLTPEEKRLLQGYPWPGNVRELQHAMERAVITANDGGPNLRSLRTEARAILQPMDAVFAHLEDVIKEHIVLALAQTKGRVSGPDGAARLLGLNDKNLDSKMRKLGIKRSVRFDTN